MRTSRPGAVRRLWVVAHRWAGLTITLFLVVAGTTGSLLAFNDELTLASRPSLSRAEPPVPGARVLDPFELTRRVERETGGSVDLVYLTVAPDHVSRLSVQAHAGQPPLGYDEVWADPYTGAIRLRHRVGVLADGPQNIMPFLYSLHHGGIFGPWGTWAFGMAALVWTIDCFVGFYLTLPVRRKGPPERGAQSDWLTRWVPAWRVRRRARGYKLHFDLHRAGGLWVWPILLVFAWSSVAFNLPSVNQPVMQAFGAAPAFERRELARPLADPPLRLASAAAIGGQLMAKRAERLGFRVQAPSAIVYYPTLGAYRYLGRTSLDIIHEGGFTTVWIDARDGQDIGFEQPTGRSSADTVSEWLSMLHMGLVGGPAYKAFVSLVGILVTTLSVTGVLIWMKKRTARLLTLHRRADSTTAHLFARLRELDESGLA